MFDTIPDLCLDMVVDALGAKEAVRLLAACPRCPGLQASIARRRAQELRAFLRGQALGCLSLWPHMLNGYSALTRDRWRRVTVDMDLDPATERVSLSLSYPLPALLRTVSPPAGKDPYMVAVAPLPNGSPADCVVSNTLIDRPLEYRAHRWSTRRAHVPGMGDTIWTTAVNFNHGRPVASLSVVIMKEGMVYNPLDDENAWKRPDFFIAALLPDYVFRRVGSPMSHAPFIADAFNMLAKDLGVLC